MFPANLVTMIGEVKHVKRLEKDFIIAWILGMLLPAVILFVAMRLDDSEVTTAIDTTGPTASEILVFSSDTVIPVLVEDGQIEVMDLENYLCGVVLAEMPAEFELEALKAQSVVARTYALRRLELGTKHESGAVCTDPACCQGYMSPDGYIQQGGDQLSVSKVYRAVAETAGQVILYDGKLIDATYFSCSGGMTEDALAVWGNDVPYLKATVSPGEENAAYYFNTVSFAPEEVEQILNITLIGSPDRWFEPITYTEGDGVDVISICGNRFTGIEIRKLLALRSTNFTVIASEDEIQFQTKGYGHRVGMSQYGAEAMALDEKTYEQILSHYYSGVEISQYEADN